MIPAHFYMTDLGKMAYLGLYLPLVLVLLWWLYRNFKSAWPFLAVLALVLLTLPFWDVYMIGRDAERLCQEKGGLRVYKTVEADSFRGGGNIVNLSQYGFKYAESYGLGGKIYRREIDNGQIKREVVPEFVARYEVGGQEYQLFTKSISSNTIRMVDLETKEVLGELIILNIYPGRFDGFILKLSGSGPVIWHCGDTPPAGRTAPLSFDDVVLATLKPLGGGSK